ncbi:hypothetical protein BYT27DRAFT_7256589 [Phlegmacium glaucopus]|nr:hypothetical protein BYT27DRAFT_7256589 [Phlegmacium glaucopus]
MDYEGKGPIGVRPTSLVSSSGKTISVEKSVAVRNDVRTKQGLAVHKELERELRMVELKVDISSEETRWALRELRKINPPSMLYLMDNKTRRYRTVPPHHDTLSGRLQLMLYRRLLSKLVAKSPPYDFGPLWKRLGVESSSRFPAKFLVQANLISGNTEFQMTCLDDVVTSWHKLQKGKAIALPVLDDCDTANTPKDIPVQIVALIGAESSTAGPSGLSDLEDAQLQWAIQQSMMPPSDREDKFPGATSLPKPVQSLPGPDGIDRIKWWRNESRREYLWNTRRGVCEFSLNVLFAAQSWLAPVNTRMIANGELKKP